MTDVRLDMHEQLKSPKFKQNQKLNDLLYELSFRLKPIQKGIEKQCNSTKWPVGFVVGNTRSGTTLITQWLASLGVYSYPSNLLTRFAYAPYIGAMIQEMLFNPKYDFQGDFLDIQSDINFISDLGKSKGALAVNEFQHFFRNYMSHTDPRYLNREELENVDFIGIMKGLASIEKVFHKPFITKVAMLKYNLIELSKHINSVFFYTTRTPIYIMQSLYKARINYYQNINIWYGSKPPEYSYLKNMDVYHQIAGQVYFTDKSLLNELQKLNRNRLIIFPYEDFCTNPEIYFEKIKLLYNNFGYSLKKKYDGIKNFEISNNFTIDKTLIHMFDKAYQYFIDKHGELEKNIV
jgi:hypothetical protein